MIELLLSVFGNPINLVFFLFFTVLGMFLWAFFRPIPPNQVLYIRERDGRGEEYNIEREDAISLETKTKPPLRFFKFGRSYVFHVATFLNRFKKITRFFAKEGTAYTWRLSGFTHGEVETNENPGEPIIIPKREELEFDTLEDAVKYRWGKEYYKQVPEGRKKMLQDDKVLVTIDLEPGLTPKDYEPITESVILAKADEDMAGLLASRFKGILKKSALEVIPWMGFGGLIVLIAALLLGWIQIGGA